MTRPGCMARVCGERCNRRRAPLFYGLWDVGDARKGLSPERAPLCWEHAARYVEAYGEAGLKDFDPDCRELFLRTREAPPHIPPRKPRKEPTRKPKDTQTATFWPEERGKP